MEGKVRMGAHCIIHQAGIGQDNGIGTDLCSSVDRRRPAFEFRRWRIRVQRHQHALASGVRVAHAFGQGSLVEVEAGEVACVRRVLEPT